MSYNEQLAETAHRALGTLNGVEDKPSPSARLMGALFLAAIVVYATGSALQETDQSAYAAFGAGLILLNSGIVISIGALMRRLLEDHGPEDHGPLVARLYFVSRVTEAVLLSAGALRAFIPVPFNQSTLYQTAMIVLGVGSVPVCALLYRARRTPRWLAFWGVSDTHCSPRAPWRSLGALLSALSCRFQGVSLKYRLASGSSRRVAH